MTGPWRFDGLGGLISEAVGRGYVNGLAFATFALRTCRRICRRTCRRLLAALVQLRDFVVAERTIIEHGGIQDARHQVSAG